MADSHLEEVSGILRGSGNPSLFQKSQPGESDSAQPPSPMPGRLFQPKAEGMFECKLQPG